MDAVVPHSGALSSEMVPPCSSTMRWQRARPMPVPPGLVEKKISNTRGSTSGGIAAPPFCSRQRHIPVGSTLEVRVRSLPSGAASVALTSRLMNTCASWGASMPHTERVARDRSALEQAALILEHLVPHVVRIAGLEADGAGAAVLEQRRDHAVEPLDLAE